MVRPRTSTSSAPTRSAIRPGSTRADRSHRTLIAVRCPSCRFISSMIASVHPCLPIQTEGLRSWWRVLRPMGVHHRYPYLVPAVQAGDDHPTPMDAHPGVPAGDEIGMAPAAEPAFVTCRDPDPVAHGDPPGPLHIPAGEIRPGRCPGSRLLHEPVDPFAGDLLHLRSLWSLCHEFLPPSPDVDPPPLDLQPAIAEEPDRLA